MATTHRTLRDVPLTYAILGILVLLLPIYYALLDGLPRTGSPTGAQTAETPAQPAGAEPACPTFPAGGMGGGCRLLGNGVINVPAECLLPSGCTLRMSSTQSTPIPPWGQGSGPAYRTSQIRYAQDPTSNLVTLEGSLIQIPYYSYNPFLSYPQSIPNYYITQAIRESYNFVPGGGVPSEPSLMTMLQGAGSSESKSIRFLYSGSGSIYYGGNIYDLFCQLVIDGALENSPLQFNVLPAPGKSTPPICNLYVCP
ncbi:hypothetical protein HY641_04915 [Candidatus Woesearchaeota archaeon]|nr:hypothetical protein [Candidatus Woesearchaeota archaeon]